MKTYALGLYEKSMPSGLTWREKLEAAKRAGFDFLEMSVDETEEKLSRLAMPEEERREIRRAMESAALPIRSICLSGHRRFPLGSGDPATRERSLAIMQGASRLAASLGVGIIQLAGYDVYYEEGSARTKQLFRENLARCVEIAAQEGIVLGFETMETEFMNTVYKAMYYVRAINSPYLQVYPDSGNLTNAAALGQTDLVEDIKSGAGHIAQLHLKETAPGKYREVPYGEGHVDFAAVIDAAWALGVRRYVAEFWHTGKSNWREELRNAHRYLTRFFPPTRPKADN